jgi:DNA-binding NarL/FixJ family response regulator
MTTIPAKGPRGLRTVLADSEPTVRNALRVLVTQGLDMQVVGEAATAVELEREVGLETPDLVIVAWNLIVTHAESAVAALRRSSHGLRVVVLDLRPETRHVALTAGADGFISMVDPPDVVARVLQSRTAATRDEQHEPGGLS